VARRYGSTHAAAGRATGVSDSNFRNQFSENRHVYHGLSGVHESMINILSVVLVLLCAPRSGHVSGLFHQWGNVVPGVSPAPLPFSLCDGAETTLCSRLLGLRGGEKDKDVSTTKIAVKRRHTHEGTDIAEQKPKKVRTTPKKLGHNGDSEKKHDAGKASDEGRVILKGITAEMKHSERKNGAGGKGGKEEKKGEARVKMRRRGGKRGQAQVPFLIMHARICMYG